ncbi:MAG: protein kinase, partial [Myxococcales bacterium]
RPWNPNSHGGEAGELVAVKVIKDEFGRNRDFATMFLDEAKITVRLRHPNIVRVHELGVDGARLFLVMELLFGQSLWNVWDACRERHIRLRYDMIAWIGARVAEGLHYAHEFRDERGEPLQIVHRDVNATNIFLTFDGQVKIIDFGLAKAANRSSKTAAGVIKGKLAYMAPEQAVGGAIDRRTDIFALATSLWELSTDKRLFKGADEVETLRRVHAAEVPNPLELVEGYPPALWAVLKRALARDPSRRHANALELGQELDACARLEGRPLGHAPIANVMRNLFADESLRQKSWFEEASTVAQAIEVPPLYPGNAPIDLPPPRAQAAPRGATVRMSAAEIPPGPFFAASPQRPVSSPPLPHGTPVGAGPAPGSSLESAPTRVTIMPYGTRRSASTVAAFVVLGLSVLIAAAAAVRWLVH